MFRPKAWVKDTLNMAAGVKPLACCDWVLINNPDVEYEVTAQTSARTCSKHLDETFNSQESFVGFLEEVIGNG